MTLFMQCRTFFTVLTYVPNIFLKTLKPSASISSARTYVKKAPSPEGIDSCPCEIQTLNKVVIRKEENGEDGDAKRSAKMNTEKLT